MKLNILFKIRQAPSRQFQTLCKLEFFYECMYVLFCLKYSQTQNLDTYMIDITGVYVHAKGMSVWYLFRTKVFQNSPVQGFVLTDIVTRGLKSRGSILFQETSH